MLALTFLVVLLAVIAASLAVREVRHRRRKASVVVPVAEAPSVVEPEPKVELEVLPTVEAEPEPKTEPESPSEVRLGSGGVHILDNPTPSATGIRRGGFASIALPFYNIAMPAFYCFRTSASVSTPWYLSGGIALANCVAAYQPKGAASLAASYTNLANPGTNDAAPGTAPTFDAATGWTLDGATTYLNTGLIPTATWSLVVRFSNTGVQSDQIICGSSSSGTTTFGVSPKLSGVTRYYWHGEASNAAGTYASGVMAVAGQQGFYNGATDLGAIPAWVGTNSHGIVIGALNNAGTVALFFGGSIQALSFYNIDVATSIAALSTAIAAL